MDTGTTVLGLSRLNFVVQIPLQQKHWNNQNSLEPADGILILTAPLQGKGTCSPSTAIKEQNLLEFLVMGLSYV